MGGDRSRGIVMKSMGEDEEASSHSISSSLRLCALTIRYSRKQTLESITAQIWRTDAVKLEMSQSLTVSSCSFMRCYSFTVLLNFRFYPFKLFLNFISKGNFKCIYSVTCDHVMMTMGGTWLMVGSLVSSIWKTGGGRVCCSTCSSC